jgi:hypothetical protein
MRQFTKRKKRGKCLPNYHHINLNLGIKIRKDVISEDRQEMRNMTVKISDDLIDKISIYHHTISQMKTM